MDDTSTSRDPFGLLTGGEGLITGTVVCAAVIAYTAGSVTSTGQLCLAIFGTVFVYWLAHLHATTVGLSVEHRHHPLTALRLALGRTWLVAGASVLPVAVLLLAELFGAEFKTDGLGGPVRHRLLAHRLQLPGGRPKRLGSRRAPGQRRRRRRDRPAGRPPQGGAALAIEHRGRSEQPGGGLPSAWRSQAYEDADPVTTRVGGGVDGEVGLPVVDRPEVARAVDSDARDAL